MEDTKYIFNNNVMGPRKDQSPVIKIDKEIMDKKRKDDVPLDSMQKRADNLTGGRTTTLPEPVINLVQNRIFAREKVLQDKYYRFIMQVAGFSNEPLSKLWDSRNEKGQEALTTANTNSLAYETKMNLDKYNQSLDGQATIIGDGGNSEQNPAEKAIMKTLRYRGSFLNSAEVTGQFFLTPNAYSHLLEAWEIIRHRCNTDIPLDELVDVEHSTYFARLVALRIQISRFLSGRYYAVSANYKRLIRQQEALIRGYFKSKLSSNQCPPNQNHSYLQQLC